MPHSSSPLRLVRSNSLPSTRPRRTALKILPAISTNSHSEPCTLPKSSVPEPMLSKLQHLAVLSPTQLPYVEQLIDHLLRSVEHGSYGLLAVAATSLLF